MSEVVMTFPGKGGDAILQWPVAWWWWKKHGKKFTVWLDEQTCRMVRPLFEAQPCVEKVEYKPGIVNWSLGGQPWHFDLPTSEHEGRQIIHLGLRHFPQRQITLETFEASRTDLGVDVDLVASEPCLEVPDTDSVTLIKQGADVVLNPKGRRILLLHGQAVCPHTRSTPEFWKFLAPLRKELEQLFDEIVFVGSERDRKTGTQQYGGWSEFDDQGSFLELAKLMKQAKCVIGAGSSVVTLAGALKVPCIRVHDPIGEHARSIWDNLSICSLNRMEVELRREWPAFRDQWLKEGVPA